jgi:hypothetical protein
VCRRVRLAEVQPNYIALELGGKGFHKGREPERERSKEKEAKTEEKRQAIGEKRKRGELPCHSGH